MTKKELSAILAKAEEEEVSLIADRIKETNEIQILKEPQKTLVMVKARETVKKTLFYLGEVLATECMVMVNGHRGVSVLAGDNFKKAVSAAIIDGYLNDGNNHEEIITYVQALDEKQKKGREKLNRQLRKSKVNFNVMGE